MDTIGKLQLHNCDNMQLMAKYPNNYFDLAVVDPPYGLGKKLTSGGIWASKYSDRDSAWDNIPSQNYFSELFRVSQNWIIWGGNYFTNNIKPARCFIVWRKLQMLGMHTMADCELALTSFDMNAKIFDSNNSKNRIHPTQKPVALYNWIYKNYSKPGFKILDTHLGSGSNAIAAHYSENVAEFVACELDKDYYRDMLNRVKEQTAQLRLF